jgi:hypothetical protein
MPEIPAVFILEMRGGAAANATTNERRIEIISKNSV